MTGSAFFDVRRDGGSDDVLVPRSIAGSGWGGNQLRGMAVSGAICRGIEQELARHGRIDLSPVRWTLDLMRPALVLPSSVRASLVRVGRRLALLEAVFEQEDVVVARASALFLRPGGTATGAAWRPLEDRVEPPDELRPATADARVFKSVGVNWTTDAAPHQTAARKSIWHWPIPIVTGEALSPFQFAASVADVANTVVNWGSAGLTYINADVTLVLARVPQVSGGIGLRATDRIEADGLSVGSVSMHDASGQLGIVSVCALANAERTVDVAARQA